MDHQSIEQFRSSLGDVIGRDYVYVTAADESRHFDPIGFLQTYAGDIFMIFVTQGAMALWEGMKGTAGEWGKQIGEQTWQNVEKSVKQLMGLKPIQDNKSQLEEIPKASDAMIELQRAIGDSYLHDFLDAGKQAVEARLIQDNFPKGKAERISEGFARLIKEKMHE